MANQAKVAQIYAELQLQTAQFKAALGEATGEMRKFSAQTRAEMREAKGALAQLGEEIGISMPRHVRSFVAELPGVAVAMNAAFDAVMVVGMIAVVVEAGKKVVEFAEKNAEAAKRNREAWASISSSISDAAAKTVVETDKLNDEIARLEKKPRNGLKDAIDESTLAVVELNKQITETIAKANELLEKQGANMLQRVTGYQAGNERLEHQQEEYLKGQNNEYGFYQQGLRGAKSPEEAQRITQEHYARVAQQTTEYWNRLNSQLSDLTFLQSLQKSGERSDFRFQLEQKYGAGGHDKEIDSLRGLMGVVGALGWSQQAQAQKTSASITAGDVRASVDLQKQQTEAEKKAAEERLRNFEQQFKQRKADYGMDAAAEMTYWSDKLSSFKANTAEYNAVFNHFAEAQAAEHLVLERLRKNSIGSNTVPVFGSMQLPDPLAPDARSVVNQERLGASLSERVTGYNLSIGKISANEAAIEIARAHAAAYDAALSELQSQYSDTLHNATDSRGLEQARRLKDQIDELQGRRKIEQMEDAQATLSTTWKGMIDSVWDELIKRSQDTAQQIRQITMQTIDGLNDQLANGMTGKRMDFGSVFETAAHGIAKTSLEKLEGTVLSSLGLGSKKRTGQTAGDAIFVTMATGSAGITGEGGAITKMLGGQGGGFGSSGIIGMLNDSNWASSLFGGKLFGSGGFFGAGGGLSSIFSGLHFATGGDFPAFAPMTVGELGPETVSFPTPGHVTSNRDSGGTGGAFYAITVNGGDPELNRVNFERSLAMVHGSATQNAIAVQRERQARRPSKRW